MRKTNKLIALFMACVMMLCIGAVGAFAQENTISVKMANFNVAVFRSLTVQTVKEILK